MRPGPRRGPGRPGPGRFGGSVAVSTGGHVDCLAAYGTADDALGRANTVDTVFDTGSVTSEFTAATVPDLATR